MNKWICIFLNLYFCSFFLYAQETKEDSLLLEQIRKDVFFLAADSLEGRFPDTKGARIAAEYISKRFEELNLQAFHQTTYFQHFIFPYQNKSLAATNLIAQTNAKKPCKIIITAHYDHLGFGTIHSREVFKTKVHNGADDNASGVAVLLALAKQFMQLEKELDFSILFICFSAHETGLFGSKAFMEEYNPNSSNKLKEIKYVFNLDMVGRLDTLQNTYPLYFRIPIGNGSIKDVWKKEDLPTSKEKLRIVIKPNEIALDDSCFYQLQISSATFSTGLHQDYHTSNDDADKLNYIGMFKIILFLEEYIKGRN